jgi:hypothetical protein
VASVLALAHPCPAVLLQFVKNAFPQIQAVFKEIKILLFLSRLQNELIKKQLRFKITFGHVLQINWVMSKAKSSPGHEKGLVFGQTKVSRRMAQAFHAFSGRA